MDTPIIFWILFNAFVLLMLALDLGVFHRKAHEVSLKEALTWTFIWVTLALVFNTIIFYWKGKQPALEFFTGYLIEIMPLLTATTTASVRALAFSLRSMEVTWFLIDRSLMSSSPAISRFIKPWAI